MRPKPSWPRGRGRALPASSSRPPPPTRGRCWLPVSEPSSQGPGSPGCSNSGLWRETHHQVFWAPEERCQGQAGSRKGPVGQSRTSPLLARTRAAAHWKLRVGVSRLCRQGRGEAGVDSGRCPCPGPVTVTRELFPRQALESALCPCTGRAVLRLRLWSPAPPFRLALRLPQSSLPGTARGRRLPAPIPWTRV